MKNKMTYVLYMIALFAFFMASVSYWGNIQLGDRLNAESIGLYTCHLLFVDCNHAFGYLL